MTISYLHLPANQKPPNIAFDRPFKAVVVLEQPTDNDWQDSVSRWLVRNGCVYVLTWGEGCEALHDAVDTASMTKSEFEEVSDAQFVMTTWHQDETLAETFWFVGYCANHPAVELDETIIIHVAPEERKGAILAAYSDAQKAETSIGP